MDNRIRIRENTGRYMEELKQWLQETWESPLEDMAGFFRTRLDGYEEHMAAWKEAYMRVPSWLPLGAQSLLDLGCGTGLEIGAVLEARPELAVTGVDLSEDMLEVLRAKYPGVTVVCADYFVCPFGEAAFDAALSFQTLHHFPANQKEKLFRKLYAALMPGGRYIEVDYLACCEEEERLLAEAAARKRRRDDIPSDAFVHFDTPLTPEHEMELLIRAGFQTKLADCIAGACCILADKA